ncbi:MAG: hypothetical protein LBS10_02615 [Gracilibacteraceae bacterium]|jgi:hypothetical protein|nr:hypothetical protein [Gracilibacteraceae bacterium]
MELWLAALLFIVVATGAVVLLFYSRKKQKKRWFIVGVCLLGAVLLILAAYIALTFLFLDKISSEEPPSDSLGSVDPADSFDLSIAEVPELYPDVVGFTDEEYGDMPTLATINEASAYVLHNILNARYELEFYLRRELVPEAGSGYVLLSAFENAMSYFPFGTYGPYDAYTVDDGDPDKVFARLMLLHEGDAESDMEARAEALEFVRKNPVPDGGFTDFESEKAYALKIHDFIARKTTYSPIGYNINAVLTNNNYEMKQEAYNVLGEDQEDAVCAAYARAFMMICHYAGINAAWVCGNETEDESHSWNVIFPCDGSEPVIVDVTWDDAGSGDDRVGQEIISYLYFYLPLDEDYEHSPLVNIESFLQFINGQ